jgi:uncharacterized membrane protein YqjE
MAENKSSTQVGLLRVLYYLFAALSFFLVFLLAVTMSTNRVDPALILTFIIAVLLLIFMLYTSQQLKSIQSALEDLSAKIK